MEFSKIISKAKNCLGGHNTMFCTSLGKRRLLVEEVTRVVLFE